MEIAFAKLTTQGVTVEGFDCGEDALNQFLAREAVDFGVKGLSATKLLVERGTMRAVGFYSISPFCLARHFLADEQLDYCGIPFPIPAWLIGRLAVDNRYQGIHRQHPLACIRRCRSLGDCRCEKPCRQGLLQEIRLPQPETGPPHC